MMSDRPRNRPRPAESRSTAPSNTCLPDTANRLYLSQNMACVIRAQMGFMFYLCSICEEQLARHVVAAEVDGP